MLNLIIYELLRYYFFKPLILEKIKRFNDTQYLHGYEETISSNIN